VHNDVFGDLHYWDTEAVTFIQRSQDARNKYPWHLWMSGDVWIAQMGVDFNTTMDGFHVGLGYKGRKSHLVLNYRKLLDDTVAFQFSPGMDGDTIVYPRPIPENYVHPRSMV
jgi:hypothetical protein